MKSDNISLWFRTWNQPLNKLNTSWGIFTLACRSFPFLCSLHAAALPSRFVWIVLHAGAQTVFLKQCRYSRLCMQTSVTNAVCPGGGQLLQCSALYMPLLSVFVRSYWGRKWVEHRQKETKQVIELNKEWGREKEARQKKKKQELEEQERWIWTENHYYPLIWASCRFLCFIIKEWSLLYSFFYSLVINLVPFVWKVSGFKHGEKF